MAKKLKYEVTFDGGKTWEKCKKAEPCTTRAGNRTGFLHYEMRDGTNGLKRPGTWRLYIREVSEKEVRRILAREFPGKIKV